jgi:tRNA pseudouridine55 synthase
MTTPPAAAPRPGLYLAHKAVGPSSHALVRTFMEEVEALGVSRKQLPVCHGGTLDPFAEGLLLLLAGPATRLMDRLHAAPKTYVADVAWGAETDTGDAGGRVVLRGDASALTAGMLDAALPAFLGWSAQVPPDTSAKKVDGEPAYKRAHRGEAVGLPPSRVYLHAARWVSHALPATSRLELACRGGFYVRALARDLGRALGCGAHLTALARTAIGPWVDPGPGASRQGVHGRALLPWLPSRALTPPEWDAVKAWKPLPRGDVLPPDWPLPAGFPEPEPREVRALVRSKLVAVLRDDGDVLVPVVDLRTGT